MKGLTRHFRQSAKNIVASAAKSAKSYADSVTIANTRQHKYNTQDLPYIFTHLQSLEKTRLDLIKHKMLVYTDLQQKMMEERMKSMTEMKKNVLLMQSEADMSMFVEQCLSVYGSREIGRDKSFVYALPYQVKDIEEGRLASGSLSAASSTAVTSAASTSSASASVNTQAHCFNSTFNTIMTSQRNTHPSLPIPALLSHCLSAMREHGSIQTEGIFRVSITTGELQSLRQACIRGDYSVLHGENVSAHAPAVLMKDWLRSLPEPLIIPALYNECIQLIKSTSNINKVPAYESVIAVYMGLPEIHRVILQHLSVLAKEIGQYESVNRMNIDNLAIVFAPCLMRNPAQDPMVLLEYTKYETKFVAALFRAIIQQQEQSRQQTPNAS